MIDITEKSKCCGCTACASVCPKNCIEMKADMEGFLYPNIDETKCIHCDLCDKACPIIQAVEEVPFKQKAYLVQNNDTKILKESTSGGAFTALAQVVISMGGIVYGAAYDENLTVYHRKAENYLDLQNFRNSKYVQSRIGDTFCEAKKLLDSGKTVLYSGTPCQIEGLKSYLMKGYENLMTVDVVCHAVPSPLIWEKYKRLRAENYNGKIDNILFRSKEMYGYQYSQMEIKLESGNIHFFGVETDPYLRGFFSDLSDRPSCYDCAFKKRYRVSDITIWDCFDVYRIDNSFADNRGVTRALVHTQKGDHMIHKIYSLCMVKEIDPDIAVLNVRELVKSVSLNPKRKEFFLDAANVKMDSKEFFDKWFPRTLKVRTEHFVRISCEKLGIYRPVKRFIKTVLKK